MSSSRSISMENGSLIVPDNPIIPFIEGDGIGPDIWNAAVRVLDSAVERAFSGNKKNNKFYKLQGYTMLEKIFFREQSDLPFYCYEKIL